VARGRITRTSGLVVGTQTIAVSARAKQDTRPITSHARKVRKILLLFADVSV